MKFEEASYLNSQKLQLSSRYRASVYISKLIVLRVHESRFFTFARTDYFFRIQIVGPDRCCFFNTLTLGNALHFERFLGLVGKSL